MTVATHWGPSQGSPIYLQKYLGNILEDPLQAAGVAKQALPTLCLLTPRWVINLNRHICLIFLVLQPFQRRSSSSSIRLRSLHSHNTKWRHQTFAKRLFLRLHDKQTARSAASPPRCRASALQTRLWSRYHKMDVWHSGYATSNFKILTFQGVSSTDNLPRSKYPSQHLPRHSWKCHSLAPSSPCCHPFTWTPRLSLAAVDRKGKPSVSCTPRK